MGALGVFRKGGDIMQVYVDGQFVPAEDARISVFDHGFLYGDGIFEGIRVYDGTIFRLQQHMQRLYNSAQCILLTMPLSPGDMSAAIVETVARRGLPNQYVRVVVSRGAGDLGLDPPVPTPIRRDHRRYHYPVSSAFLHRRPGPRDRGDTAHPTLGRSIHASNP
jgi:branched-subunit amino acid aminotransferase/4-amino-4-deoxychorismate lyase